MGTQLAGLSDVFTSDATIVADIADGGQSLSVVENSELFAERGFLLRIPMPEGFTEDGRYRITLSAAFERIA